MLYMYWLVLFVCVCVYVCVCVCVCVCVFMVGCGGEGVLVPSTKTVVFYIHGSAQHFEIYAKFCSFRNDLVFRESYYITGF